MGCPTTLHECGLQQKNPSRRRRINAMHWIIGFGFLIGAGAAAAAVVIPVKPGDDLHAALGKARQVRVERPEEAVEIRFAAGRYAIEKPLTLGLEDSGSAESPLRLIAADGAKPVISGGRILANFTLQANGRWQTKVDGLRFEQLWVNGRRATRAREPNTGMFRMKSIREEIDGQTARQTVEIDEDAAKWLRDLDPQALAGVQMLAYHKWDNTRRFIEKVDGNRFTTKGKPMQSWNHWDAKTGVVFENLAAGLDEPGEWFLSEDGVLTYIPRPGETIENAQVIAPVCEQLLVIKGSAERPVSHVEVRGISFHNTGWICPENGFEPSQAAAPIEAVIQIDHARDLTVDDCEIAHGGIYGLWMRTGSRNIAVTRSYLHDLGAGGLRIGTTEEGANSGGNRIENCIVRDGGKVFPCAVGIWIGHSGDNAVMHNDIGYFAYTGISVGWRWGYAPSEAKRNRIELNHIHHIGNGLLSDMGGIYTLGPSEGTVLRNNHIHDILSYDYGGWGLYNDEGSTGILLENNLVYRTTSGGYHQHYGKENVIRNNIFAFARDQQLQFTRPEDQLSFDFTHNIVLWEKGPLWSGGAGGRGNIKSDYNLYWRTGGGDIDFFGAPLEEWQKRGHDVHSIVADPGFINPAAGDFRFKDPAIPARIGFKPFDVSQAGVTGSEEWKKLAAEVPDGQ